MVNVSNDFMRETDSVIDLATQMAQRFGHRFVDTEHILLALVAGEDGTVAKLLAECGLEVENLLALLESVLAQVDPLYSERAELAPRAKRVIELAQLEAYVLNSSYCGPEHLLLGILHEGEGVAVGLLETSGFAGARLYAKFASILRSKCPRCGAKVTKRMIDYPLILKCRIVIARNVGAEVCSQCGEVVEVKFVSELQERVRHLAESGSSPSAMAEVPVYDFDRTN
jgi:YgiT-type zinc finger domain-containing protein